MTATHAVQSGAGTRAPVDARARLHSYVPAAERRIECAGITTPVLESGEGPPLLLLHPPGEFAAKFFRVWPALARDFRVIAPDLPGHGASTVHGGELDERRVLAWLDDLISATCATPPIVAGHILGGAIAARFAIRRPDALRGLVLVDTLGLAPFRPAPSFAFALLRFSLRPSPRSFEGLLQRCLADADAVRASGGDALRAFEAYMVDCATTPLVHRAMGTLMRQIGVAVIPERDLKRITVPTSLIWGRLDQANRLRIATRASARYGWPLRVIEDAADDPIIEQPDAFVAALRASAGIERATPAGRTA